MIEVKGFRVALKIVQDQQSKPNRLFDSEKSLEWIVSNQPTIWLFNFKEVAGSTR